MLMEMEDEEIEAMVRLLGSCPKSSGAPHRTFRLVKAHFSDSSVKRYEKSCEAEAGSHAFAGFCSNVYESFYSVVVTSHVAVKRYEKSCDAETKKVNESRKAVEAEKQPFEPAIEVYEEANFAEDISRSDDAVTVYESNSSRSPPLKSSHVENNLSIEVACTLQRAPENNFYQLN